ncbi:hypothetical protein BU25DRAFT_384556 [Macroventuria anomochaeta]|uniref:Uncharacterized protein n=1 Tax=Macroventuria anomochaeta TaxID=301207 RepID=A0ACB6SBJ5_9PLEO|nr:uncharacterized protein BU25DRAFT_384556 [Macroventuria anomochaeta]KAF2631352.1 hypothetical protein BU25DRAFT_384556 [Macroventuria anomochaeta]
MKTTIYTILPLAAFATAFPSAQNAGRPVATGSCCVANTSLKQDVCNINGQSGRCVPSAANNCGGQLTCIEDNRLQCDANTLERGRPLCRLASEFGVIN